MGLFMAIFPFRPNLRSQIKEEKGKVIPVTGREGP
jgi:hypothetical protein